MNINRAVAGNNAHTLFLCWQTALSPVVLYRQLLCLYLGSNLKHSHKSETALVPKLSPLHSAACKVNPSIPLPQSALSSPFFFFFFLSRWGRWAISNRELFWKFINSYSQATPPSLCSLLRGPFPSSSPSGLLERRALSWPCVEKMAEFIPCCVGDNTPKRDTSRLRLQVEDSFLAFSLSPRLQCWH